MSIQCHACIGGTNVGEDIRKLDYGQHVVSGTPGRVFGKFPFSSNFLHLVKICCHVETASFIKGFKSGINCWHFID